jgi:hypothetical protein
MVEAATSMVLAKSLDLIISITLPKEKFPVDNGSRHFSVWWVYLNFVEKNITIWAIMAFSQQVLHFYLMCCPHVRQRHQWLRSK